MNAASIIGIVKKQPVGFICGALSLVCAILLYVRSDKIEENQAAYEEKSAEASKILANVRNAKDLPEQVAEIQALTKELDSRLVRAGQLAINQQYFYKLEAETEVKLVEIRPSGPTPPKGLYITLPYNLGVHGNFKQLMAFLQQLESGRHFCRFGTAIFSKVGTADDMSLTLTIELLGTQ
jgi:Tfp pilus assembly protein PilO